MFKKINWIGIICLLLLNQSNLQSQGCDDNNYAYTTLNGNNISTTLLQSGSFWWNGNSDAAYNIPISQPGLHTMFAGGIWIGGIDENGDAKFAYSTYGHNSNKFDYRSGYLEYPSSTNSTICQNWNRFFIVNDIAINGAIEDYNDNGQIDGILSNEILGWPAMGNAFFADVHGFDLPDNDYQELAPFYDRNGNGVYEPMNGDHPDIHGATQGIWWVFNDAASDHTASNSEPLGVELQLLAYVYESTEEAVNNSSYYDIKITNKSELRLDSVIVGIFSDPDLGCAFDDYIGCVPEEDLVFVYNSDNVDGLEDCECLDLNTYCNAIPITGIKLIDGPKDPITQEEIGMSSFFYYKLLGPQDTTTYPPFPDVVSSAEYYHYLNGRDLFNEPFLDPEGNAVDFAYAGNPATDSDWTMCSEETIPGDFRMVMNVGSFSLAPLVSNQLTFAVVTKLNVPHPCPDISMFLDYANVVKENWEPLISATNDIEIHQINIQPNPFNEEAQIILDQNEVIVSGKIYSLDGKIVRNYTPLSGPTFNLKKGHLNTGMYVLQLQTKSGKLYTGKFIISE